MSFVGDMVGSLFGGNNGNSGNAGMNFQATGVPTEGLGLQQGVTTDQIAAQYAKANSAINAQQSFVNALADQNSIGNLGNLYGQQQGLANQFQGIANGTGPNPALQQLQNTTGQNIANQGALMASQRGAGANVGLLARQAALQGGNLQQQAIGQGAALQAQQQLAALSGLQNQQSLMGGQQLNQAQLQLGGANQVAGNAGQLYGNQLQALGNYNSANAGLQGNINSANAGIAGKTAEGQQAAVGAASNAIGTGLATIGKTAAKALPLIGGLFAHGGQVPHMASGGMTPGGARSYAGNYFSSDVSTPSIQPITMGNAPMPAATPLAPAAPAAPQTPAAALYSGINHLGSVLFADGGSVKKPVKGEALAAEAKKVPGKAKTKGDSLKNDTVPAMLSPGEVVIPKSIMESSDPVTNAAKFVHAVMMKNRMGRK